MRILPAALVALLLLSPARAESLDGVAVYRHARTISFRVLKNAKWVESQWSYRYDESGSGFGWRKDGWIVVAARHVRNARTVHVVCPDGATREADRWHWYRDIELAVVHVPDYEVEVAALASDHSLEVGSPVFVFGYQDSQRRSFTRGIVSGLHRTVRAQGQDFAPLQDYVQIDAQAHAGSPGGPVLSANGEVVGMVCMSRPALDEPAPAMSYAMPVDSLRAFAGRLIEGGRNVELGAIECAMRSVDGLPLELRRKLGVDSEPGVLLFDLGEEARAAGLRQGDVVLKAGGVTVENGPQLRVLIAQHPPHGKLTLTILRDRERRKIQVVLAERP